VWFSFAPDDISFSVILQRELKQSNIRLVKVTGLGAAGRRARLTSLPTLWQVGGQGDLMRRMFGFATLAFLAGLAVGSFSQNATHAAFDQNAAHTADMAAIDKLHNADVAATLTQDPKQLSALFSDNAVNLVFEQPAVGIKSITDSFQKFRAQHSDFQVLKYENNIKDVQIVGDWAIEVGVSQATFKMSAKDDPISVPPTEGVRVLKRQSDGSWKFAVVGLK
jgi:ketosteroid isomerase-like protein